MTLLSDTMIQYVIQEDSKVARMGRPPGPKKNQRKERITVPLNKAELDQIIAAVEASGIPAATFCRMILLKATETRKKAGA